MNRSLFAFAVLAPLSVFACEKTGSETQHQANQAQAEANKESNQAATESTTRITNAEVTADKKIADAQRSFSMTREDYRHTVQTNLDDLDKKLSDLDAKAMKATGKRKTQLDTNLPMLHARRDAFARDFASIENDTAVTWDATKARLDKEWSDLKSAVDKIE